MRIQIAAPKRRRYSRRDLKRPQKTPPRDVESMESTLAEKSPFTFHRRRRPSKNGEHNELRPAGRQEILDYRKEKANFQLGQN